MISTYYYQVLNINTMGRILIVVMLTFPIAVRILIVIVLRFLTSVRMLMRVMIMGWL